jgi:antitoxin YefM
MSIAALPLLMEAEPPQREYESLQETLALLSVPGFRESLQQSLQQIQNNETYSLNEVLGDID